jgi:RHS repeat-associated protein
VLGRGDGQGASERHDYFPYGEEMVASANNRDKFGTYSRDGHSGLDYADQRYYASKYGRFRTSDPYEASGGASEPGSWNRYPYVGGDPVNFGDPKGLLSCWYGGTVTYANGGGETSYLCQGDFGEPVVGYGRFPAVTPPTDSEHIDYMIRVQEALAAQDSPGGMRSFRTALRTVAAMDFSKCGSELQRLTGQSVEHIRSQARASAAFVYDGTTSPVLWTSNFGPQHGNTRNLSPWTIGDGFKADVYLQFLSQADGHAIFMRPESFEFPNSPSELIALGEGFWPINLYGETFGYATALHEVLHKYGLTDGVLRAELQVQGRGLGSAEISHRLAELCW